MLWLRGGGGTGRGGAENRAGRAGAPLLPPLDRPHADNYFYDTLPFNKLQSPPKQVSRYVPIQHLTSISAVQVVDADADLLDYADADYLEIYADGPIKYKETSEKNASIRRSKIENRAYRSSNF